MTSFLLLSRQVIADALSDGMLVGLIAGTQSGSSGDEVAASAVRQLGPELGGRVRVCNCSGVQPDAGEESSVSQAVAAAVGREKERLAAAFVSSLQQDKGKEALPIELSPSLMSGAREALIKSQCLQTIS